jgi:hypothetical protein
MIFRLFLIVRSVVLERFLDFREAYLMAGLLYKECINALFFALSNIYRVLFKSNDTMRYGILFGSWYYSLILLMNFWKYFLVDLLSNILRQ